MNHHMFGPSSLDRRCACPKSYSEELGKQSESTEYSRLGDAYHAEMHSLLANRVTDENGFFKPFDDTWFDGLSDPAAIMLDRVMTIAYGTKEWRTVTPPDNIRLFSELELKLNDHPCKESLASIGEQPLFGTTDVVIVKLDEVIIIDFKTGHGEPAKAENTLQTAAYALMACVQFQVVTAWAYIVNPNYRQQDGYYFTEQALINVHKIIQACIRDSIAAINANDGWKPSDEACKYCKGNLLGTCPAVHQIVDKLANSPAAVTVRKGETHPLASFSDDELCDLKAKATIATKAIKAIDDELRRRCEGGNQCGPYFLKPSSGQKKITDLNKAFELATKYITPQEFLDLCSVSVPALKALYATKMKQYGDAKTKLEAESLFDSIFDEVMGSGEDRMVLTKAKE